MMLFVILLSMLMTTLYSKICDQASDLLQQLQLASKLEPDLQETVDWGTRWPVDFSAGKTQLVLFDQSNNTGVIDVKMDGSALEEKSYFKMLGLSFSILNWIGALTLSLRVGINDLWFVSMVFDFLITNQFLDPRNQKFVELPFFMNHFFRNMITLK